MPKKIQRKHLRYLPVIVDEKKKETKGLNIQAAVTVLGGVTGIIVSILWVAGRYYANGYFSAMNIPLYQINYSIWEYAEASWLLLIFYFLKKIYPPTLLLAIMLLAIILLILIIQKVFLKLKIELAIQILRNKIQALWQSIRYVSVTLLVLYFLYLLLLSFVDIKDSGKVNGQLAVLQKSQAVEVFSKESLPLGNGQVVSNTSPTVIRYSDLRLLTFNNGKYYLFREIDPFTCKPKQVFIIDDSPDMHLVLGDFAPVNPPCITIIPTAYSTVSP